MEARYAVVQYTTRGRLTGKVFGPFPTEQHADDFVQSALVGGMVYIRVKVTGTFTKEVVLDAARRAGN